MRMTAFAGASSRRSRLVVLSLFFLAFSPLASAQDEKRVLAFGDSNTWGWSPVAGDGFPAERHGSEKRWAGVLDRALSDVTVVVDGLVGRRSDLDADYGDKLLVASDFNGANALPDSIARHAPVDLVVIMLGTNDLQAGVERPPEDVAKAVFGLAELASQSSRLAFTAYPAPRVLIVAPPALGDTSRTGLGGLFQAGEEPSRRLGATFAAEAERTGVAFFDASTVIATDGVDGIHLTAQSHETLGKALAPVVESLLKDRQGSGQYSTS